MTARKFPLCLIAALAACAAPSQTGSPLAGSVWRFVEIDNARPASDAAKLTIETDHIGANVGCNGMGGPWRVEKGRLIAGPLVQTQMYCKGPVWDQERAVAALLAAAPKVQIEGNSLVLKSSGHSAELERVREVSPRQ